MKITKTAVVSVVGRPNVGKSTLTNRLVGQKVAIVSSKPQTTRTRITGLLNKGDTQFVFLDTPGLHKPRTQLGDYMCKVVTDTVSEVDVAVLVVEPIPNIGPAEESLIAQIKQHHMPAILVINKIDTVEKEALLPVIAAYQQEFDFDEVIPISAKWRDGVATLLESCEKYAQPGPMLFPEDMVTDMPEKQVMAEIIREKLLWNLEKEIPHGTAVEITKFSERDDGIIDIDATIYCEKQSHKGIIIGKHGDMLKHIVRRVAKLGIADRFHFTGFLRGEDVHKMFQLSDVYVMPSVSEPFGISPLEAMRSNVPVIISKQSGVAEVLDYAVKVDYWDVDALADAIYGLIKYPALSDMFASKGLEEVTNLKWNDAAAKIKSVYETVIEENKKQLK